MKSLALLAVLILASVSGGYADANREYSVAVKVKHGGEAVAMPRAVTAVDVPVLIGSSVVNKSLPEYAQKTGIWIEATPVPSGRGVVWDVKVTEKQLLSETRVLPVLSTKSCEFRIPHGQAPQRPIKLKSAKRLSNLLQVSYKAHYLGFAAKSVYV